MSFSNEHVRHLFNRYVFRGFPPFLTTKKVIRVIFRQNSQLIDGFAHHTLGLGLPPTQYSSHHQDYDTFLVGNPYYKPSFVTGILGGGVDPNHAFCLFI